MGHTFAVLVRPMFTSNRYAPATNRTFHRTVVAFLAFLLCVVHASPINAASVSPTSALRQTLDRQNAWLGTSSEGEGWNKFLLTKSLEEEIGKGSDIDKREVAKILARYNSNTPGVEHPVFAATGRAIEAWANHRGVALAIRWSEEARTKSGNVAEVTDEDIAKAREELEEAVRDLDARFAAADEARRVGWKKFLKWDLLEEGLQTDSPDWKALSKVGAQFFNGYPGLEYPEFVRVRKALQKYVFIGSQISPKAMTAQMKALANVIDTYNKEPTTQHAGDVAAQLDWLDQFGAVPELAPEIRSVYSQPNVRVRVSEELLKRRFSQDVNQPAQVNEMILGTHVRGTAMTSGKISADVVDNNEVAQIDIVFRGQAVTNSVGRQKPVTIRSRSFSTLSARKPLFIFPQRIASARARAAAKTRTKILSITPDRKLGRRIVKKIARKRANEQLPKTQVIASQRTARRLEKQIEDQSEPLLARAREALARQLSGPLKRRGLLPESLKTMSKDSNALLVAHQATSAQFATMSAPPNFSPHGDVVAQVHESAFNNTAEKGLAGLRITDKRVAELAKEALGSIPEELQTEGEDSTPWSLSFAWNQPVTVEFDDEVLRIAIRARQVTSGDRKLDFGRRGTAKYMEIAANYTMSVQPTGVQLTRKGDVDVNLGGKKIGIKERVFTTLMERKFEAVFKQNIQGEGFELPGQFADMGKLRLNDLSADDGWLSVGWQ